MNNKRILPAIGALYVAIGVVTFGHSSAHAVRQAKVDYAACQADLASHKVLWCTDDSDMAAFKGMAAAMLWPLYWSWEAFA